MKKKVIVIGRGFGGLASAIRLTANGHQVNTFEKRDQLGARSYDHGCQLLAFQAEDEIVETD